MKKLFLLFVIGLSLLVTACNQNTVPPKVEDEDPIEETDDEKEPETEEEKKPGGDTGWLPWI